MLSSTVSLDLLLSSSDVAVPIGRHGHETADQRWVGNPENRLSDRWHDRDPRVFSKKTEGVAGGKLLARSAKRSCLNCRGA